MPKLNCWEVRRCGLEPGGERTGALGVCPAASAHRLDGLNGGTCGGRACWAVAGTLCSGSLQGSFTTKALECASCEHYRLVCEEEGEAMVHTDGVLARLFSSE